MVGDMVSPVSTISGPRMKITRNRPASAAIVMPGRFALGKLQAGMIDDLPRQMREVLRRGRQVAAEMAAPKA